MSSAAMPLPRDIRLMTRVTSALGWVLVALVLVAAGKWATRHPVWTLKSIQVQGELEHQNEVTFRAHLASQLHGNFITLDLEEVKHLFETVPWVRQAVVQRDFPNRLKVTLQEHHPVAWWGSSGGSQLVDRQGEVFEVNSEDDDTERLPELAGPTGQAPQVMALRQRLLPAFERLDMGLQRLELTAQGSWRATLDSGALIELGRGTPEEIEARVQQFTATLTQVTSRLGHGLEAADLRYPQGYTVRVRGVSTLVNPIPPKHAATAPAAHGH
jgi:cell division protein FtsQ